jgi:hypothetical protein
MGSKRATTTRNITMAQAKVNLRLFSYAAMTKKNFQHLSVPLKLKHSTCGIPTFSLMFWVELSDGTNRSSHGGNNLANTLRSAL